MWLVAVVILLLLGVELLMRALAHVTTEPVWWHDLFTQRKEVQVRQLRSSGGVDVIFVGTSMMLLGLDTDRFVSLSGLSAYNASIYRGIPMVSEAWLADVVLPQLRPAVVVVGMSPFDVNDNGPLTERHAEYRAAKVFTGGWRVRVIRRAGASCYIIKMSPLIRQPRKILRDLRTTFRTPTSWRWHVPPEIPDYLGPGGQGLDFLDRTYRTGPKMLDLIRQQSATNYVNGGTQRRSFARIVQLNASYGATTVFVAMPVSADYLENMFPGGRAGWEEQWQTLRTVVAESGALFLDVAAEFEGEQFYADMIHMNRCGRDSFTDALSLQLAPLARPLAAARQSRQ